MNALNPLDWWRKFLALPNDSRTKTFVVAFLVAAVSALAVSITAVSLKPRQEANAEADRQQRMVALIASVPGLSGILENADVDDLDTRIVDLVGGVFAEELDPAGFDVQAIAMDPERSIDLDPIRDMAGIGRRPNFMPVHLLHQNGDLRLIVLPAYGSGYKSTIRAYIALAADLNTIEAISIYDQDETAGLGSRITDPDWLARWQGKKVADETGTIRINVGNGGGEQFEVDGISGATRSSNGVANLVRFWLGELGYGPFLDKLAAELHVR